MGELMSELRTQKQDELLEHVEQMVRYWASEPPSNVPPEMAKLDALSGLAFSILVMLDGGAAVGPYAVVPLDEDGQPVLYRPDPTRVEMLDLAGELHERQKEVAERMARQREQDDASSIEADGRATGRR
jgi:hypothetical protein